MKKLAYLFGLSAMFLSVNSAFAFDEHDCPTIKEINSHASLIDSVYHDSDVAPSYLPFAIYDPNQFVYSSKAIKHGKKFFYLHRRNDDQMLTADDQKILAMQNIANHVDKLKMAIDSVYPGEFGAIQCIYIYENDPMGNWVNASSVDGHFPAPAMPFATAR